MNANSEARAADVPHKAVSLAVAAVTLVIGSVIMLTMAIGQLTL